MILEGRQAQSTLSEAKLTCATFFSILPLPLFSLVATLPPLNRHIVYMIAQDANK